MLQTTRKRKLSDSLLEPEGKIPRRQFNEHQHQHFSNKTQHHFGHETLLQLEHETQQQFGHETLLQLEHETQQQFGNEAHHQFCPATKHQSGTEPHHQSDETQYHFSQEMEQEFGHATHYQFGHVTQQNLDHATQHRLGHEAQLQFGHESQHQFGKQIQQPKNPEYALIFVDKVLHKIKQSEGYINSILQRSGKVPVKRYIDFVLTVCFLRQNMHMCLVYYMLFVQRYPSHFHSECSQGLHIMAKCLNVFQIECRNVTWKEIGEMCNPINHDMLHNLFKQVDDIVKRLYGYKKYFTVEEKKQLTIVSNNR